MRHVRVDELLRDGLAGRVQHDVVTEQDGERLPADEVLRHEHRVPEAKLLSLVDERDGPELADAPDRAQHLDVAAILQPAFELRARVEVVLDRAASAGDDDDDLLDPAGDCLLDGVLDDRPIDERHHLLGDRLRRREEAGAEARGGQDGLSDAHGGVGALLLRVHCRGAAASLHRTRADAIGSCVVLGTPVYPSAFQPPERVGRRVQGFGDARPADDLVKFRAELALADLGTIEKALDRLRKQARAGEAKVQDEVAVVEEAEKVLGEDRWLSEHEWEQDARKTLQLLTPLTLKPVLHVLNLDEAGTSRRSTRRRRRSRSAASSRPRPPS